MERLEKSHLAEWPSGRELLEQTRALIEVFQASEATRTDMFGVCETDQRLIDQVMQAMASTEGDILGEFGSGVPNAAFGKTDPRFCDENPHNQMVRGGVRTVFRRQTDQNIPFVRQDWSFMHTLMIKLANGTQVPIPQGSPYSMILYFPALLSRGSKFSGCVVGTGVEFHKVIPKFVKLIISGGHSGENERWRLIAEELAKNEKGRKILAKIIRFGYAVPHQVGYGNKRLSKWFGLPSIDVDYQPPTPTFFATQGFDPLAGPKVRGNPSTELTKDYCHRVYSPLQIQAIAKEFRDIQNLSSLMAFVDFPRFLREMQSPQQATKHLIEICNDFEHLRGLIMIATHMDILKHPRVMADAGKFLQHQVEKI